MFLTGAVLLMAVLAPGLARTARAAGSAGYDVKRDPAADVRAAVQVARTSGQRILLEVGGEWCNWCHVLQDLVTSDKEVGARLREGFILVKVNWSPENENTRFLSAYPQIPAYPHFFVLDSNGTYLWSQSGAGFVKGTGYDRTKFLAFLKKWSPASPQKKK
jgi:thiol:disulfide interchange protein